MENILKNISKRVADWSCGAENPDPDKREIVAYGIEIKLETYTKMIIFFVIAVITDTFPETCVIFGCFCGLRRFAGGKHLKSSLGCFGASALVWLISIVLGRFSIPIGFLVLGMIVSILMCWNYAPADTKNNPIIDQEYRRRRKLIATAVTVICLIIMLIIKNYKYKIYIVIPVMIEALSLIQIHSKKNKNKPCNGW